MLAAERRRLIAESIRSKGVVSVAQMADALGTTEITIRRDMRSMDRERLLVLSPELTVVTNSLLVAQALMEASRVEVILTGGTLRRSIHALVGPATEESVRALRASQAFISGNGFTAARGLSTPSPVVAATDRALAGAAQHVVVLADHTKIGQETMCQTVPAARVQTLITDSRSDRSELEAIHGAGVDVLLAEVGTGERARSAAS